MELLVRDIDPTVARVLASELGGLDGVVVDQGDLTASDADAWLIPSPGIHLADRGLPLACRRSLGIRAWARARAAVERLHAGPIPVGEAVAVGTGRRQPRWLILAPAVADALEVRGPEPDVGAGRALAAALQAASSHGARRLACPGLGTGEGGGDPAACARAMRAAWLHSRR